MPSNRTTTFGTSDTPTKKPEDGHFANGQWLCNCQPRLPAIQFQVKRETKNKGRWFYTCQVDRTKGKSGEPARCNFFLWAEDARLREESAVLNNSTTEPGGNQDDEKKKSLRTPRKLVQTTLSARVEPREEGKRHWSHRTDITPIDKLERTVAGSQKANMQSTSAVAGNSTVQTDNDVSDTETVDHGYGASDMDTEDEKELSRIAESAGQPTSAATRTISKEQFRTPSGGGKRKRDVADLDKDDDLFEDMGSDEERELAAVTDSVSQPSRNRDAFTTPLAQRATATIGGMPTPSTTDKPLRRVLFTEPKAGEPSNDKKRLRNDHAGKYAAISSPKTPSSSQEALDPSSSPPTPGSASELPNITEEIMTLLDGQNVDLEVIKQIRQSLNIFSAKARGLEKGRNANRHMLKIKESKIADLQSRVTDLENRQKLDRESRLRMRSGVMNLHTET